MCNSQNAIVILFLLFFSLSFSFGFHIDALLKYFQGTMCAKNNLISQANTVIYGLQIYVISIVKLVVLTSAGLSICGCTITTSTPCMHSNCLTSLCLIVLESLYCSMARKYFFLDARTAHTWICKLTIGW